jgi:broad specificity phosphatase PhoE
MDPASIIAQSASSDVTTFIVVRHAEKADSSADPDLSEIGQQRAERLATMLASLNVDGCYSTPYKRTQQTLMPVAKTNDLEVMDYDPRSPAAVLEELKSQAGKTFVIAGHSNTAPLLVNYLNGQQNYSALDDSVYDHLWVVTVNKDGTTHTLLLHY